MFDLAAPYLVRDSRNQEEGHHGQVGISAYCPDIARRGDCARPGTGSVAHSPSEGADEATHDFARSRRHRSGSRKCCRAAHEDLWMNRCGPQCQHYPVGDRALDRSCCSGAECPAVVPGCAAGKKPTSTLDGWQASPGRHGMLSVASASSTTIAQLLSFNVPVTCNSRGIVMARDELLQANVCPKRSVTGARNGHPNGVERDRSLQDQVHSRNPSPMTRSDFSQ